MMATPGHSSILGNLHWLLPGAELSFSQQSTQLPASASNFQNLGGGHSPGRAEREPLSATQTTGSYECFDKHCDAIFQSADELKRHVRGVHAERIHHCESCPFSCTRRENLVTHERSHTGEKPYPCGECEKSFARSDERARHWRSHSRQRIAMSANEHQTTPLSMQAVSTGGGARSQTFSQGVSFHPFLGVMSVNRSVGINGELFHGFEGGICPTSSAFYPQICQHTAWTSPEALG